MIAYFKIEEVDYSRPLDSGYFVPGPSKPSVAVMFALICCPSVWTLVLLLTGRYAKKTPQW